MLKDFVNNKKPGEDDASDVNERILHITPQNAEYVHFNCNKYGKQRIGYCLRLSFYLF